MTEVTVYRYGHRPQRDKRVTTHVALTARAFGSSGIIVDTSDVQLEESIKKVVAEFGGNFSIKSGVPLDRFLKNSTGKPIIHLTMYGLPLDQCVDKLDELMKTHDEIIIFVGAEKVPGRVYGSSTLNISVTSQPISEISALAILMDRMFQGKELSGNLQGRMRVIPMERGKRVEVIPSRHQCMEILRKKNIEPGLIEKSIEIDEKAMIMAANVNCNRAFISACALLLPLFISLEKDSLEEIPESVNNSLNRIAEYLKENTLEDINVEERIIIDSMSSNPSVDHDDEESNTAFKDLM